jgi:hypothetical protein
MLCKKDRKVKGLLIEEYGKKRATKILKWEVKNEISNKDIRKVW